LSGVGPAMPTLTGDPDSVTVCVEPPVESTTLTGVWSDAAPGDAAGVADRRGNRVVPGQRHREF
jgi:hypothetical protein